MDELIRQMRLLVAEMQKHRELAAAVRESQRELLESLIATVSPEEESC